VSCLELFLSWPVSTMLWGTEGDYVAVVGEVDAVLRMLMRW